MKLKKIMASFLAAATAITCLTACKTDGNSGSVDNSGDNSTASGATLRIGGSGPLTGDYALYGNGVKNGAQLAVDEINAAGGINGVTLELRVEDDEAAEEKAVNAYNVLKDWDMDLSIGTVTSGACIAFGAEAAKDNMFLLTPSSTAVECIAADNAFRVCFSDPNQGVASADYIADQSLATKIAAIYQSDNAYSAGIFDKFKSEASAKNLEIVSEQSFTSDNATDFSAQIQSIKDSGAELLFLPIYYSEASLILQQAKNAGLDIKVFGCDGLDGILNMKNFDVSLAEGVMLLTPFAADATDEATVHFVTEYRAKYGDETMNQFAADAYDAIYIIKAAAEKANINADMSASEICDALKTAMTEITVDGVTGTSITWAADGEPSKAPKAVVITDGSYKAM